MQRDQRTVAGEIHRAIRESLGETPRLIGAGLTDQGVHAEAQVANFLTPSPRPTAEIAGTINAALPADINILKADEVPARFHARHDATSRRYRYQIALRRTAFFKRFVWWVREPLDPAVMEAAARALIGRHEFLSFADRLEEVTEPRVRVSTASFRRSDFLLTFTMEADHFLPRMVRRVVGVLVEIGTGRLPAEAMTRFLTETVGDPAQWTAPPSGLFLERVIYPSATPVVAPRHTRPSRRPAPRR